MSFTYPRRQYAGARASDDADVVGGDVGENHRRPDDGPLDDVEDEAVAVVAHAGLDELGFGSELPDLQALDLLVDGFLGLLVIVSVVHDVHPVRCG